MKLVIVDYGSGNLTSVSAAVRTLGVEPVVSGRPQDLADADKIVLPGVGAFGDCMANLAARGLVAPLAAVRDRIPILGICVGAQMMCRESDEFGHHLGLGWIDAVVRRIVPDDPTLRVPHVGWDDLHRVGACPLFDGLADDDLFYYVHSYAIHAADPAVVAGECDYGGRFVAAFRSGAVYGVQFHPEKSQKAGLAVLGNFVARG